VVVQPVPHVEAHVFLLSQLYVTSFGPAAPPSAEPSSPPSATVLPKVQCPPAAQVQVLPVHEQSPVHVAVAEPPASGPPSTPGGIETSELLPQPSPITAAPSAVIEPRTSRT
jgi:hypothetical protein